MLVGLHETIASENGEGAYACRAGEGAYACGAAGKSIACGLAALPMSLESTGC